MAVGVVSIAVGVVAARGAAPIGSTPTSSSPNPRELSGPLRIVLKNKNSRNVITREFYYYEGRRERGEGENGSREKGVKKNKGLTCAL